MDDTVRRIILATACPNTLVVIFIRLLLSEPLTCEEGERNKPNKWAFEASANEKNLQYLSFIFTMSILTYWHLQTDPFFMGILLSQMTVVSSLEAGS